MPDNLTSGARVQGSVSTGYSDRPVARAIKIKHAGLNLTGPAGMGGALCIDPEAASRKLQA